MAAKSLLLLILWTLSAEKVLLLTRTTIYVGFRFYT
jgi:hypothetical protein